MLCKEEIIEQINNLEKPNLRCIDGEDISLEYGMLLPEPLAKAIFNYLEKTVKYYDGHLAKVQVFGRWHNIPRSQVAYGDSGLSYSFSGNTVPALPWDEVIDAVRQKISALVGTPFNFVLINRYKTGSNKIGWHKDDERDLDSLAPIASISLGQQKDFLFRHDDKVQKDVKIILENGSLLLMKHPTNQHWKHSLPLRKKITGTRINLTFRKMQRF